MDERLIIIRGEERRLPGSGKGEMLQPASAGKDSMLLAAPSPPVITSPAMGKVYVIQTTNGRLSLNQLEQCVQL